MIHSLLSAAPLRVSRDPLRVSHLLLFWWAQIALSLSLVGPPLWAQDVPDELQAVKIVEHLGESVRPEEFHFQDERNERVNLGQFFHPDRPVVLTLVYYSCPNLCNFMLEGLVSGLKQLDLVPGRDFELVSVSIKAEEDSTLAAQRKEAVLKTYGKSEAALGWHFMTGGSEASAELARRLGFGFRYDKMEKQFAHGAVIFVLTPNGRISRYLYGIEYRPEDLRLALVEAAQGKMGTFADRMRLFCYRYDPQTRRYSLYLTRLMQVAAVVTTLLVGLYLFVFWRRQRKESS